MGYTDSARVACAPEGSVSIEDVRHALPATVAVDPTPKVKRVIRGRPVSLEELLREEEEYPSSDGLPMADNTYQAEAMHDAFACLREYFREREDVFVACDLLMYYRPKDKSARVAPDIMVAIGSPQGPRMTYKVWEEGPPDFVLEVASPRTVDVDVLNKPRLYADLGVREYWQYDPIGDMLSPRLQGRQLVQGDYTELPAARHFDGSTRIRSDALGLELVFNGERLRFWDSAKRRFLRTLADAEQAQQQAEKALSDAEQAQQQAEQARRDAERFRRAEILRQQDAESEARAALARVAELEALLKDSRNPH